MRKRSSSVAVLMVILLAAGPAPTAAATSRSPVSLTDLVVQIGAVGDIACKDPPRNNRRVCRYDDVSDLVWDRGLEGFLVLGDVQYEYGCYEDFMQNYDAYFGRVMDVSYPAIGNHDYCDSAASGYARYFGERAHGPDYWYSFDLGAWHLIALNTNVCSPYYGEPCGPGHPQYEWLKADLAGSDAACTLAFFHHPRWDWLKYQNASWTESFDLERSAPFYRLLYRAGADVILAGHNHNYQRYAPSDPRGKVDRERGIVQFVVGTGGRNLNDLGAASTRPANLVTGQADSFGILRMNLEPDRYDYRFATAEGSPRFTDSKQDVACH